jgi:hypothetical protein
MSTDVPIQPPEMPVRLERSRTIDPREKMQQAEVLIGRRLSGHVRTYEVKEKIRVTLDTKRWLINILPRNYA